MSNYNENDIKNLIAEMSEENYFSSSAVLSLAEVRFDSKDVSTLAIRYENKLTLEINMDFVNRFCRNESHIKALIMHELLHVILNHTSDDKSDDEDRFRHIVANIAFDAVINAMIHREYGEEYSSFMSEFYKKPMYPFLWILRPPPSELNQCVSAKCANSFSAQSKEIQIKRICERYHIPQDGVFVNLWCDIYKGKAVAEDVKNYLRDILKGISGDGFDIQRIMSILLGSHNSKIKIDSILSGVVSCKLSESIGAYPGLGNRLSDALYAASDEDPKDLWMKKTRRLIIKMLSDDGRYRCKTGALPIPLPFVSPTDKKSFVKMQWSEFLTYHLWELTAINEHAAANVYLDVSLSMSRILPLLIKILSSLTHLIKQPFWAFSTEVSEAIIENGHLKAASTGGTSLECVLKHILSNRVSSALIITDGYIENLDKDIVQMVNNRAKVFTLISPGGSAGEIKSSNLGKYIFLEEVPSED